jgi:Putative bacterial lipoprotein (DUF799)
MRSFCGSTHSRSNDFDGRKHSPVGTPLLISWSIALIAMTLAGCSSSASNYEQRRFFQKEYGLETHGRKTWFDHLVEVDPGGIKTTIAPNYEQNAPLKIALLPFTDRGSANYVVDKIQLTFRNRQQRENWAWTDANRTRRALIGFLAEREFVEANIFQIDAVLKEHGIDSEEKLDQVPPATLGQWLGVDAVVYGEVTHYEAYYAALVSAWQVGADVKMVSTHDGRTLFVATGSRYAVNLMPAFDPIDIAIDSGLTLLELRDVTLARAEEENAREIVLRIPRSSRLENQLIEEAHDGDFVTVAKTAHLPADATPSPAGRSLAASLAR